MKVIPLILEIIFLLAVFAILHSYVFFPILLKLLSKGKKNNDIVWLPEDDEIPFVSIVMAAYNEAAVIEEKIRSIYNTTYPLNKIEVLIGSDNSSDETNLIINTLSEEYASLKLFAFSERQGKANIINGLSEKAEGEILILTDANVYFSNETIYQLVKHYRNKKIELVGGLILNTNLQKTGISYQEKSYLTNENVIKYREGVLWGAMIGAFGGVYSIRKRSYCPVPQNFYMDDFYITLQVLKNGGKAILEPESVCYEDISNLIKEEFRRKVRISIGNFQNLNVFKSMLFPPTTGLGFSFLSHKVLRWHTPFFLLYCLFASAYLSLYSNIFLYLFLGQVLLILIPFFDFLLKKIHLHVVFLRFITHFYSMNLALLIGFVRYINGVESNIWQPTKRNQ